MAFIKGQSGNPNGRPRGVPDRRTLFREQLEARLTVGTLFESLPTDHVPDVLVTRTGDCPRVRQQNLFDEFGKSAGPVRRPVLLGKGDETFYEVPMAFSLFNPIRHISPPRDSRSLQYSNNVPVDVFSSNTGAGRRTRILKPSA